MRAIFAKCEKKLIKWCDFVQSVLGYGSQVSQFRDLPAGDSVATRIVCPAGRGIARGAGFLGRRLRTRFRAQLRHALGVAHPLPVPPRESGGNGAEGENLGVDFSRTACYNYLAVRVAELPRRRNFALGFLPSL